ncbi:MAG: hypothetical protein MZU95_03200 [Desulfomicrobium escambiense]|nr:hypothetical protein [Desulfomicrobium escambiense]
MFLEIHDDPSAGAERRAERPRASTASTPCSRLLHPHRRRRAATPRGPAAMTGPRPRPQGAPDRGRRHPRPGRSRRRPVHRRRRAAARLPRPRHRDRHGQVGHHRAARSPPRLSSTGTPAFFLHPAEAVHGDLGAVQGRRRRASRCRTRARPASCCGCSRPSGASAPRSIAMTGSPASTLGRAADVVLDCGVDEEACPLNLAPTASTHGRPGAWATRWRWSLLVREGVPAGGLRQPASGRRHRQAPAARRSR